MGTNTKNKSWFTITTGSLTHIIKSARVSELLGIATVVQELSINCSSENYHFAQQNCYLVREALWKYKLHGKIKCKRTLESLRYAIDHLAKTEGMIELKRK